MRVYLVGGAVRDLLLGRPVEDLDLSIDGDVADFATRLAGSLSAESKVHARFATATLTLASGERLDIAGVRREQYERPGALPRISLGASIEEDLARRDFTVNAMALELAPGRRLLDPFAGREDLEARTIRFLYPGSAVDDPTRAYRAVRYAIRLDFRIASATRREIAAAVKTGAVNTLSGDRLRREIGLILSEPGRVRASRLLARLGLDAAIEPALARPGAAARLRAAEQSVARGAAGAGWLCYLLAWMAEAEGEELRRVADRLAFAGRQRERLIAWPTALSRLAGIAAVPRSEQARRLRGLGLEEIAAAAAVLPAADRRALQRHAARPSAVRLGVAGRDLVAAGIAPGPVIGRTLAAVLAARQDGRISSREELAFALRLARRETQRR